MRDFYPTPPLISKQTKLSKSYNDWKIQFTISIIMINFKSDLKRERETEFVREWERDGNR